MMEMNQERERKVATAAASLYASNMITLVLNTAFIIFITNTLSISQVGLFSILNIIVLVASTFSVLALPITGGSIVGTPPAVTRFLPDFRLYPSSARRLILTSSLLSLSISVLSAFVVSSAKISNFLVPQGQYEAALYASLDCVAYSMAQIGAYSLIGIGRATLSSKVIIFSNSIRYTLSLVFLSAGFGVGGIFLGFVVGDSVLAISGITLSLLGSRGVGKAKFSSSKIAYYSLSVFGISLTGLAVTQLDKIVAYLGKGLESLGIYNVAVVGASIVSFAPSAIINALVSYMPVYKKSEIPELVKNYTRYVSILATPLGFVLASVSPYILTIFGPEYSRGAPVLAAIAVALSATSVYSVFASGLLVSDSSHLFTLSNITGVLLLIFSSYIMIPYFGILGIAFGRVIMLVASSLMTYLFAKRKGIDSADWKTNSLSILASFLMSILVFLIGYFSFSYLAVPRIFVASGSILLIVLGLLVYLFELKLMRILTDDDIEFLRRILPEKVMWIAKIVKKFT
jgi:O-antigen/teichoic acid export membrane protein